METKIWSANKIKGLVLKSLRDKNLSLFEDMEKQIRRGVGKRMRKYNNEEKDKLLLSFGWEKLTYYFPKEGGEWTRDLEEAWECLIDEVATQYDCKDDEAIDSILIARLKQLDNKEVADDEDN